MTDIATIGKEKYSLYSWQNTKISQATKSLISFGLISRDVKYIKRKNSGYRTNAFKYFITSEGIEYIEKEREK